MGLQSKLKTYYMKSEHVKQDMALLVPDYDKLGLLRATLPFQRAHERSSCEAAMIFIILFKIMCAKNEE